MTNKPGQFGDGTLDHYLDGLLDEEAAKRIEERIEADPDLKAEVERQTAVNDAVQHMGTPPPGVDQRLVESVRKAAAAAPGSKALAETLPFYRRRWAIAALLALFLDRAATPKARLAATIGIRRPTGLGTEVSRCASTWSHPISLAAILAGLFYLFFPIVMIFARFNARSARHRAKHGCIGTVWMNHKGLAAMLASY